MSAERLSLNMLRIGVDAWRPNRNALRWVCTHGARAYHW